VGASRSRIVVEELLPNTTPILLAQAALNAAAAIFTEASLSFVGLGVQPPSASWGTILQQGYANIHQSLWYPVFPGAVIILAIWLLNALSDRLQSLLDPRTRR
jgi:peptide/nickel transport system permease protein